MCPRLFLQFTHQYRMNVAKICSYGKWVIIATILFLAHQCIKYQQYVTFTFPKSPSPPPLQRNLLVSTTAQPSPIEESSPFKSFPKTPIEDKAVAVMVNTTMKKLSLKSDSKSTLRFLYL